MYLQSCPNIPDHCTRFVLRSVPKLPFRLLSSQNKPTTIPAFLKKKSVTLLIGVERAQVDTVLEILEKHAKKHIEASFVNSPDVTGVAVKTPVKVETGGTVAFVMDVLSCVKF